jgi:hypothetical protein
VLQKGVGVRVPPLAPWKGRIVGLVRRFAKPLRVETSFEGSNPSPSATEEPAVEAGSFVSTETSRETRRQRVETERPERSANCARLLTLARFCVMLL